MIHASISFNLDLSLIQTALPLFQAEAVEGIEWSFDTLHDRPEIPEWFVELLQTYSDAGRLVGHGVYFSLFTGKWLPEQSEWLALLQDLCKRYAFDHVSEHFGFFTGSDFHKGAPLSLPYSARTLTIGQDRLKRIAAACGSPVGLENLAFASDLQAARVHGAFLEELLAPVNGFAILDLHNLYCQIQNFGLPASDMLAAFPLQRVREIHISGGSWEPSAHRPAPGVRRDTHDDRVPEEVFALLELAMPLCPNLKFVVMEQLGSALHTPDAQADYREDFLRMRTLVHAEVTRRTAAPIAGAINPFLPGQIQVPATPLEDAGLYAEQMQLSAILEGSTSLQEVEQAMAASALASGEWALRDWDPAMLETAWQIARKWKDRF